MKERLCARCGRSLHGVPAVHVLLFDSALTVAWIGCSSCAEFLCTLAREQLQAICLRLERAVGGNWWGRKSEDVAGLTTPQLVVDKANVWYLDLVTHQIRGAGDLQEVQRVSNTAAGDICAVLHLFNAVRGHGSHGERHRSSEPPPLTA